jgi:ABC-type sugar transport system substrate-binding protein
LPTIATAPRASMTSRRLLGIVAVASLIGIAGCSSSASSSGGGAPTTGSVDTAASGTTSAPAPSSLKGKTVALLGGANTNPWAVYFNKTFTSTMEAQGVKVTQLLTVDSAQQVQYFNQAVSQKPAAIFIEMLDAKAVVPAIRKAHAASIPVVAIDSPTDPSVASLTRQVLTDNTALGTFAAQNIVEGLKAEGKTSGNVIAITGFASMSTTQQRMAAFKKVLAGYPQYKLVDVQDGQWDPVKSGQIATQLFAKYGKNGVAAAYGMADYMAVPIVAAAKQAGMAVGLAKKGLIVTGSNCFKAGIDSIKAGQMYGTATDDPGTIALTSAKYGLSFLSGKSEPMIATVVEHQVTPSTVGQYAGLCGHA